MLPVLEDLPPLPLLPLEVNYEFRVSVPGYGVDNGLTTCLRRILKLHPKERQRGTVTLFLFIHILKLRFFWAV